MSWAILKGTTIPDPDRNRMNDVVVRGNRAWAVSKQGAVLRLRDDVRVDATAMAGQVRCVGFDARGSAGWIGFLTDGGAAVRLKRTVNGGDDWNDVADLPADSPRGVCGIAVVDESTAFACGTYDPATAAGVWRTTDGARWQSAPIPAEIKNLTDLYFWDARRGVIAGGAMDGASFGPAVFITEDGGGSWRRAKISGAPADRSYVWKLFFVNDVLGYASVANTGKLGMMLKTSDAGETWSAVSIYRPEVRAWNLQGIGFVDAQRGWVCQFGGDAFETTDGGTQWRPASTLSNVNRFRRVANAMYASGRAVYRLVV